MQFLVQIQGGVGPDVWDKEMFIEAADFDDAAGQAYNKAEELCGQVTLLEQCDCSEAEALERHVSRFLSWKLPKDFSPDAGISFKPTKPYEGDEFGNSWWPVGTNLLTAEQAREMLRHVLGVV